MIYDEMVGKSDCYDYHYCKTHQNMWTIGYHMYCRIPTEQELAVDDGLRRAVPGDLLNRLSGVSISLHNFCCVSISSASMLTFCNCIQYMYVSA